MLNFIVGVLMFFLVAVMCYGAFHGMTAKNRQGIPEGLSISVSALVAMYIVTWVAQWFGWRP